MTPAQAPPIAGGREAFASEVEQERPSGEGDEASQARRTYRGRDLSEVLPRIREELGPEAIVTHQREGLVGGIGGFFAHRFIEVEAMAPPAPPAPGLDVYDGEDADPLAELDGVVAMDVPFGGFAAQLAAARPDGYEPATPGQPAPVEEAPTEVLASARSAPAYVAQAAFTDVPRNASAPVEPPAYSPQAHSEPAAPAEPFASLRRASFADEAAAAPLARHAPVLVHSRDADEDGVESVWVAAEAREAAEFMIAKGMSAHLAEELIGDARAHDLPFAGAGGMRDALHACIARRLPRHGGMPRDGALIALVGGGGSGKTRCAAALAASYAGASALDVRSVSLGRYASGAELAELVAPHGVTVQNVERGSRTAFELAGSRDGTLVVADTQAVSPADPVGIGMLGVELDDLRPEEVLVALPATANPASGRQMLTALEPLHPTGLIVTHADETDQIGGAIELSLESGLPLVFVHDGLELPGALRPADPATIAERLLS